MVTILLNKVKAFLMNHTVTIVLICVACITGALLVRKGQTTVIDQLQLQASTYDNAIKKITAANEEERKQHEENIKKLQKSLDEVALKHDEDMKALNEKKTKQVNNLVQRFEEDPTSMASDISKITGIQLYKQETK